MGRTLEEVIVDIQSKSNTQAIDKTQKSLEKLEKQQKKQQVQTDKNSKSFQKFNMNALGVLFFGKAMADTFGGLLQPAADAFGIFDLWGITLLTVFLPIMQLIFPALVEFMMFFMNLPDEVKVALGGLVLLGLTFGILAFISETLNLGLTSLGRELGTLPGAIAGSGINGLAATLASLAGKVISIALVIDGISKLSSDTATWYEKLIGGLSIASGGLLLVGGKAAKYGAYAAVGLVAIEIIHDNLTGTTVSFFSAFSKALIAAFAGFTMASWPGAIIALTGVIVFDYIFPKINNDLKKITDGIRANIFDPGADTPGKIPLPVSRVPAGQGPNLSINYSPNTNINFTSGDLRSALQKPTTEQLDEIMRRSYGSGLIT